jgi:hypothetical protein
VILGIIVISLIPVAMHALSSRRSKQRVANETAGRT